MGSAGLEWEAGDVISAARMNQKCNFIGTGAQINALSTTYPGMRVFATSTDGAIIADYYYVRNAANSAWTRELHSNGNVDTMLQFLAQAEIRFADSDSSNYEGFKAPGTVTANKIWTLPDGDGTNGQVMKTNGSAVLAWGAAGDDYLTRRFMGFDAMLADGYINSFNNGTGSVAQLQGMIQLQTGATIGGDAGLYCSYVNTGFTRNKRFEWHTNILFNTATSIEMEIGLTDNANTGGGFSGTGDDFAVFYLDTSVSANWFTKTNDNGTAPAGVDTTVAAAVSAHKFSILSDETDIKFYIDGTLVRTATTDLPTITTSMGPRWWVQCEAGSNRDLYLLACQAWQDDFA